MRGRARAAETAGCDRPAERTPRVNATARRRFATGAAKGRATSRRNLVDMRAEFERLDR